jgi:hypothetical protein
MNKAQTILKSRQERAIKARAAAADWAVAAEVLTV